MHHNINKVRVVWRRLGKLLQQEGADKWVLSLFYRELTQAFLMFGLESWALSDAIMRVVGGNHVVFPRHITGNRAQHQVDGTWETPVAEEVLQTEGMQSTAKYIVRKQVIDILPLV